ncbi:MULTISPECIES: PhnD/SsuA/transferrin family substrate-binding protein [Rhodobacterales]|uniref:phosphate/phosphite/phosphonate ABC transporter substrate-binding protein n=1 Tax=Roseobacter sp. N2S TaxID=2663844 RepID=UPI002862FFC2|nr:MULTISPECIES: PhnD/SsuA/transferrin family substrate-binding protein [Rhodobacterales]MDR6264926.1 ABC-type phosphate/phosphonate transport system substrate-binding protein [Roseobacter sp. N2S]
MTRYRAALPMYDLPEFRAETDAFWQSIQSGLHKRGVDPLVDFYRPENDHDAEALLAHPRLLFSQTCWGPISCGQSPDLHILAQPDFSAFLGGQGPLYRSAIIATGRGINTAPPADRKGQIPVEKLAGKRLAFNDRASLSGYLSITADMAAATGQRKAFYSHGEHSGSHRHSVQMVAEGKADVAAIDCRTWAMLQGHDPAVKKVHVIGWTQARKGLPYVCSPKIEDGLKAVMTETLVELGSFAA